MDRGKVPIETTNNRTHVAEEYSLGLSLTENHNIIHIHKKKKEERNKLYYACTSRRSNEIKMP